MESYWILGAGRFGSLAVERILKQKRGSRLLVVDRNALPLNNLGLKSAETTQRDGIEFLLEHPGSGHEFIVPAIPVHVAFAWLSRQLAKGGKVSPIPVPAAVDHMVPNPGRDKTGGLYASFATFRCPDNCDEPAGKCTVTGENRKANMFALIRLIEIEGLTVKVVRSQQITPGVGGYRLSVLWSLLEEVQSAGKDFMVATACRCHAVIHALRWHRTRH